MDRTSRANEENISFLTQVPKSSADPDVVLWVVPCVHAQDRGRWTLLREHANDKEKNIMNPLEIGCWVAAKAVMTQSLDYSFCHGYVWDEFVVNVLARMNATDRLLSGLGICCYL